LFVEIATAGGMESTLTTPAEENFDIMPSGRAATISTVYNPSSTGAVISPS